MIHFRGKFLLMMRYVGMTNEYELHLLHTVLYREIMKLGKIVRFTIVKMYKMLLLEYISYINLYQ